MAFVFIAAAFQLLELASIPNDPDKIAPSLHSIYIVESDYIDHFLEFEDNHSILQHVFQYQLLHQILQMINLWWSQVFPRLKKYSLSFLDKTRGNLGKSLNQNIL